MFSVLRNRCAEGLWLKDTLPNCVHGSLFLPVTQDRVLTSQTFLGFRLSIRTSLAVGTRRSARRFERWSINHFVIKSVALVWCIFIDVLYYRTPFKVTIMGRGEALSVVFFLLISDSRMLINSQFGWNKYWIDKVI